jgi:hypothetical protein
MASRSQREPPKGSVREEQQVGKKWWPGLVSWRKDGSSSKEDKTKSVHNS